MSDGMLTLRAVLFKAKYQINLIYALVQVVLIVKYENTFENQHGKSCAFLL